VKTASQGKSRQNSDAAIRSRRPIRVKKERVLIEFPSSLLERADRAAVALGKNRSELIRAAIEQILDSMERKKFETELAAAYAANAKMNLDITEEFAHVDGEGIE